MTRKIKNKVKMFTIEFDNGEKLFATPPAIPFNWSMFKATISACIDLLIEQKRLDVEE